MPSTHRAGADIWWESTGSGEPVVLLNGLGSPSATWFRLARLLRPQHTVITVDNRGTGRTVAPEGPHDVPSMAADVAAVLDAAGVASAHVVGHSMGGFLAQELALTEPGRVRSLVLAGTHAGLPHLDADPAAGAALAASASLPPAERATALRGLLYAAATDEAAVLEDEAVRAAHPTSPEGFRDQLLGASAWERLSDLGSVTTPTLVIHGAEDRIVPPAAGRRLAEALPAARFELVEGAGHALFTDATGPVAGAILGFFSAQSALAS